MTAIRSRSTRSTAGWKIAALGLLAAVACLAALQPSSPVVAQTPPGTFVRILLACDDPSAMQGTATIHFHLFRPAGLPPLLEAPPLACGDGEASTEFGLAVRQPLLWHVVLTATTAEGSLTCQQERPELPSFQRCGEWPAGVSFELSIVEAEDLE